MKIVMIIFIIIKMNSNIKFQEWILKRFSNFIIMTLNEELNLINTNNDIEEINANFDNISQ